MREWKKNNKEQHRALNKKSRRKRKEEVPQVELLKAAKRRARERGLEITITAADIVVPTACPYLGIPLKFGVGRACEASPSLDRIDIRRGYVPGNVRVISEKANRMKSNATAEQLLLFAKRVLALHEVGTYT